MDISSVDDLLSAARLQQQPQRLLFVFARADLPDQSTQDQRAEVQTGRGGVLTPLACVDKAPDEIASFAALAQEALQFSPDWAIVFASSLSGRGGQAPTSADAEAPLQRMVEAIKAGSLTALIPFDRNGDALRLSPRL